MNTRDNVQEIDPALDPTLDQLSRRTLLGRMGAGAAAAVAATTLPGTAGAQDTPKHALDDDTLKKEMIKIPIKDAEGKTTELDVFVARPKAEAKRGTVLVIHEIFGLTDHIKDIAARLAQAGYIGIAPNLFTREGKVPDMKDGFGPLMQFVSAIPDSQIMHDLDELSKWARKEEDSNGKVGIMGFCWGGRVSMLADALVPDLNAAVAYYGRIVGQKTEKQPASPLDLVDKMKKPLLGHFGAKDTGIPVADVKKLQDALTVRDRKAELHIYEGAGHAFNNDTRESYHAESAKLAWKRTLDWYAKYLK